MADTENRERSIVAQLSPGDMLGPQKEAVRGSAIGTRTLLGVVLGQVRGLSYRHNPQDETTPSIALVGPFKFVPADIGRPEIWSMRAFLPGAVHDAVVESLEGGRERPVDKSPGRKEKPIDINLGAVLPIVLEVGAEPTEAGVGYKYYTQTSKKVPMQLVDPLAELSAEAGVKLSAPAPQAQLAGPTADNAPAVKKARKK